MTTRPVLPLPPPPTTTVLGSCSTCSTGCRCPLGDPGCGHYGCRGRAPVSCFVALASQAAYEERLAATRRYRAVLATRRAAWRSTADAALLANLLP